jgi:hypothetical protein
MGDQAKDIDRYGCRQRRLYLPEPELQRTHPGSEFRKAYLDALLCMEERLENRYYLRTKAAVDAIKFTVEKQAEMPLEPIISSDTVKVTQEQLAAKNISDMACSLDNPEGCEACGS